MYIAFDSVAPLLLWIVLTPSYSRTGRRVWDLSFSYLSDTDIFPINASTSIIANIDSQEGYNVDTSPIDMGTFDDTEEFVFSTNIINDTDFFSSVWNKTLGSTLPFIFQPDGGGDVAGAGNFNADQFALCKFKDDTLQYERVASNVYNIKLKIEEVW